MTIKEKKQQKEVAEKLKKHWNDTDIPWNPNYKLNHLYKTDNKKESNE